jgi:hypothetical protein
MTAVGNYYDIINNEANGCSASSDTVAITSLTGIEQPATESRQVTLYPNPGSGEIHIVSTKVIDAIKVTNVLGQVVYESEPKQSRFIVELNDDGMYFVTINSGNETITSKLVVSK